MCALFRLAVSAVQPWRCSSSVYPRPHIVILGVHTPPKYVVQYEDCRANVAGERRGFQFVREPKEGLRLDCVVVIVTALDVDKLSVKVTLDRNVSVSLRQPVRTR